MTIFYVDVFSPVSVVLEFVVVGGRNDLYFEAIQETVIGIKLFLIKNGT